MFESKYKIVSVVSMDLGKKLKRHGLILCCAFLLIFSNVIVGELESNLKTNKKYDEECVSVIIAGSVAKDGRAILMKNRDTNDAENKPVYHPASEGKYAFIGVNTYWMGINEQGLAVMNTLVGVLKFGGAGMDNGALNAWIVKHCETVEEVCFELNNTESPIGPGKRLGGACVGVIDRFGNGAFIEISGVGAYARFIVDGYDSQANHPRCYPGYASGPSGRDAYALEILGEIYSQKGFISWEDVAQNVSRYVHHKELGSSCFSISGEMCRDTTQAAMVAVSGDSRYEGKLNCMWGEYGNPPMVGLFVPSIVHAGEPPTILNSFWNYVWGKRSYAHGSCGANYDPVRVREIQSYTFFAEDYTFDRYDDLMAIIPGGLSDAELKIYLQDYVHDVVQVATNIYIEQPWVLDHLVVAEQIEFHVTTVSNSTVSDFEFVKANMEIGFNVTGPPGSLGFCYITIPMELLDGIFTIIVGDDGHIISEPILKGNDSLLYFTYNHSAKVRIIGTTVINEFSSVMVLPLFVAATLVAILIRKKKGSKRLAAPKVI